MANGKLLLHVITPNKVKLNESADMVILRSVTGDMGILPGHAAFSALLDQQGILRVLIGEEEQRLAVFGGFADIRDNKVTIVTELAEWPEDIDHALAEMDRQTAEERLREKNEDVDLRSEQVRLRRSLVRIEVSSYPIIRSSSYKEY